MNSVCVVESESGRGRGGNRMSTRKHGVMSIDQGFGLVEAGACFIIQGRE